MTARRLSRSFVATALAVVLVMLPALPVMAEEPPASPVIASGVSVGSVDLSGLDAATAREALVTAYGTLPFSTLPVTARGRVFALESSRAVTFDADGLIAEAFAATGTVSLEPRYSVSATVVAGFVSTIARTVYKKPVDAKRSIVKRRLRIVRQVAGWTLDQSRARTAVSEALLAAARTATGTAAATLTLNPGATRAKIVTTNIGKTIVVSLRERVVLLYSGGRLEERYRCAIGMRSNPTPTGVFKVIGRSSAPAWRNPGSDWAKSMPAYIKPGPTNPLGLRALYLNAPGIRIHGTHKTWSIGTAASHGCVRLKNTDVVDIYPRVKVGTPVYILK